MIAARHARFGGALAAAAVALGACRADSTPSTPALGTAASTTAPPRDDAMPTLPFDAFLPELDDRARRQELYSRFVAAEREAKTFAATPDRWVVIRKVRVGSSGAKWLSEGAIDLAPNAEAGTLFHEIFHTAFHKSVFHEGANDAWGEAWCDAFRHAAERELLGDPPSPWVQKVERYATMSYDEVMAKSGDRSHDQKYAYPASLIVRRAGTMASVRALWQDLGARHANLDATFGYSPPR